MLFEYCIVPDGVSFDDTHGSLRTQMFIRVEWGSDKPEEATSRRKAKTPEPTVVKS
jgi:hypothetical protein